MYKRLTASLDLLINDFFIINISSFYKSFLIYIKMSKDSSAQQDLLSQYLRKTTKKAREWYFFEEKKKTN